MTTLGSFLYKEAATKTELLIKLDATSDDNYKFVSIYNDDLKRWCWPSSYAAACGDFICEICGTYSGRGYPCIVVDQYVAICLDCDHAPGPTGTLQTMISRFVGAWKMKGRR